MAKIMGIDYGTVRIGVALSDINEVIASGIETIHWGKKDIQYPISRLLEIIQQHQIEKIVIGLPKRTDAKISESEQKARAFGDLLTKESAKEVIYLDERFTSVIAGQIMREVGVKTHKKRNVVDQIAAEIILQDYLDRQQKDRK